MHIKGSTGRNKKECLSRYCERLELRAVYVAETGILSFLFRVLAHGGKIVMTDNKGDECEWTAPGLSSSPKENSPC